MKTAGDIMDREVPSVGPDEDARAGREAARRIGVVEAVIATDVIDSIAAGMVPGERVE